MKHKLAAVSLFILHISLHPVYAQDLSFVVQNMVVNSSLINEVVSKRHAQNNILRGEIAEYLPHIDVNFNYGVDRNENFHTKSVYGENNKTLEKRELSVSLNQMLFDGFETKSRVEYETANLIMYDNIVIDSIDELIFDIVKIYLSIISLNKKIASSKEYIKKMSKIKRDNIYDETYSSHAAARAKLIMLQKELRDYSYRFKELTETEPKNLYIPKLPSKIIPKNEGAAVGIAVNNSIKLKMQNARVNAIRAKKRETMAKYYPTLSLSIVADKKDNINGLEGTGNSVSAELQMKYNVFNGGRNRAKERSAAFELESEKSKLNNIKKKIIRDVEETYNKYISAKSALKYLKESYTHLQNASKVLHSKESLSKDDISKILTVDKDLFITSLIYTDNQNEELVSKYELLKQIGKIREHFNVNLPNNIKTDPPKWFEVIL